jgi:hypothetical protein
MISTLCLDKADEELNRQCADKPDRKPCVKITFDTHKEVYEVSDEYGYFASADTWMAAVPYIEDLLAGPSTGVPGSLRERAERFAQR